MTRYESNKKILEVLSNSIESYKDIRFIQLLWSLGIVSKEDKFYEESETTLKKLQK